MDKTSNPATICVKTEGAHVDMSTGLHDVPQTVPAGRKSLFKKFRRWVGKRLRALFRNWHRYNRSNRQKDADRVEVVGKSTIYFNMCVKILSSNKPHSLYIH